MRIRGDAAGSTSEVAAAGRRATRVTTVELLFDLVFVVTIAQLATVVSHDPGWESVARAGLLLVVVWWMYDAFAWLTNQATPDTRAVRLLFIAAMAAFLVLSLAIPDALEGASVLFGAAYAVIALVHGGLFIALGGVTSARVMLRVMPINVGIGALIGVAGLVEGPAHTVLLLAPLVLIAVAAGIAMRSPFDLVAEHFVERHGLLVVIALGESVVSVGAGVGAHDLGAGSVLGAVLVVGVIAALWWCYFSGDDERATLAFGAVEPRRRTAAALRAFFVDHLLMLFGLVLLGAGLHLAVEDALHPPTVATGWLIAAGVALFLVGDADYRRYLGLGAWWFRAGGAAAALLVGALASLVPSVVVLAALGLVVVATIAVDRPRPE
ncbi:low temperature requirement protein A [Cellulomonas sp.]|uniref:low temperature requirement protein A n=1 Tax=Cellulomonas sp. TaxID=40001 RepID=UPI001B16CC52|nr:low temperature requirement protein A [Cellulomonas sp.]MBO9555917.1 low temperature requirement protein A [Cellulomonas sp.]